jgi:hypothetical protein
MQSAQPAKFNLPVFYKKTTLIPPVVHKQYGTQVAISVMGAFDSRICRVTGDGRIDPPDQVRGLKVRP